MVPAYVMPLWPWTVTFWPQNLTHSSLSHNTSCVNLVKIRLVLFKISYNKPRKCSFQHTVFHRDLDLWSFDPKLWSVHLCPIMHRRCKFGENISNTLHDIVLTMIRDAHTDARTHGRTGQNYYASGHNTLGRGIKMTWCEKLCSHLIVTCVLIL